MKYDWITIALENGGILTTAKNAYGINASMHWENGDEVCGEDHSTLPDALISLNSALEDDAAEECCPSNAQAD
jgi:hypothetical protein